MYDIFGWINQAADWVYQLLGGKPLQVILNVLALILSPKEALMQAFSLYKSIRARKYAEPHLKLSLQEPIFVGMEDGYTLQYCIGISNERLTGWAQRNAIRNAVENCLIEVTFKVWEELLAKATIHVDILKPDSDSYKLPLVTLRQILIGDTGSIVSLDGTDASTSRSSPPPLKIPVNSRVIAMVDVTSPSLKKPSRSVWIIDINLFSSSPLGVRRIYENEL